MKKKILALFLAVVVCFAAAACSPEASAGLSAENYQYGQLKMGGGGFVTAVIAHPTAENVIYARTDVGGAYRWNAETKLWESMSYGVSEEDKGLLSVDGIALDPNDPAKVYMVCGCEYFSNGKTVVYRSDDYGKTFAYTDVSELIKVHGNGMGRQNGERIAVDPATGAIICGGRIGGLIKSADGGVTWEHITSFTVKGTSNSNGVCSVLFDKDSGSVFAAVSATGEPNVYVSADNGASWNTVASLPSKLMVQHMRQDGAGNLIITYANAAGPWDASSGAVYKYNIASGEATEISPNNRPFGDVAVDPANPDRMIAVTINTWMQQTNGAFGDQFFTTTDGGASWTEITSSIAIDTNNCPWIDGYAIHWCGCLMLNPSNTDSLTVTSGNGIFTSDDIWSENPTMYFNAHGLEETVPLDIVSVPGGPLITAVGDYDGCVYTDTDAYGTIHSAVNGSCSSIAVGGESNEVWTKVGTVEDKVTYLVSTDAGATWKTAKNPADEASVCYGGFTCVSNDGKRIFWSPQNNYTTYYSDDLGQTWTRCKGIFSKMYMLCDSVDGNVVYACGGSNFYVSTDGGASFQSTYMCSDTFKRFCVVEGEAGKIYLPMTGSYAVSTDFGKTFTYVKDNGVSVCECIGIGAPSEEGKPYVIYLWGNVNDEGMGVYASEDEGASWTKLTDEEHQFGGYGNGCFLIGDMNEYGKWYFGTVGMGVAYGELKPAQ